MAAKTLFTDSEFGEILSTYDLGEYKSHRAFEKGTDQTNILLTTTRGKYAFRYYEKRSRNYVQFEIDLLQHLVHYGYPSPAPISNLQGGFVGEHNGKPFAIFEFLAGKHDDHVDNFQEVAKAIARLHAITRDYEPTHAEAREGYDVTTIWRNATANAAKLPFQDEAYKRLSWLRAELDRLDLPENMPNGVVHGDTNASNFLYLDGRISAVLDFDQASYTYLLYDLANIVYWWTWPNLGDLDFAKTRALVANYELFRPLYKTEKEHFFDMLKLCNCVGIGWCIDEDDFPNNRRKVDWLNSIGSNEFYTQIFE